MMAAGSQLRAHKEPAALTLGVVAVAETVAETGGDSNNILEGAAKRDARDVVDQLNAELGGLCCSSATPS